MDTPPAQLAKKPIYRRWWFWFIVVLMVLVLGWAGAYYFIEVRGRTDDNRPCSRINQHPPEMTWDLMYCQGVMCRSKDNADVTDRETCESIDILDENLEFEPDGLPDCEWHPGVEPSWAEHPCQPNK